MSVSMLQIIFTLNISAEEMEIIRRWFGLNRSPTVPEIQTVLSSSWNERMTNMQSDLERMDKEG